MQVVKAIFDGENIQPVDPVHLKKNTEVLVIFPSDEKKYSPEEARKRLRGSGKGEYLTKQLLKSRGEDLKLDDLVKSRKRQFFVIPVKTGIQSF